MANIYINKQTRQIFADRLCRNPLSFDSLLPTAGADMALVLHAVDANGPSTLTSPAVTIASKDVPAGGTITLSYNGTSLGEISMLAGQAEWEAYINANASVAALGGFDAFVSSGRVVLQSRAVGTFADFAVVAHDFVPFGTATLTQTAAGDANEREIWVLTMELGTIAVQNSFSQSSTVAATITELVTGSASVAEVQRITLSGEPIRGYWNITTASGVTLPLKWDVGPRHIEAAMNTKLGAGTVVVSQSAAFSWDIAWTAVGVQSALTATVSGLTGLQASTGTLSLDTNEAEALPPDAACQVQITDGTEVIYSESVSIGNLNLVGDTPVTQTAGVVRYDTAQTLTSGETAQARDNIDAAGSGAATASGLTMATARLLGRSTASTGAIEEITVGTGLSLSGGTLSNSATTPASSYGGNGASDADKLLKFSADGAIYASIEAGVTSSNGSVVALATDGSTIGIGFAPLDVANGFTGLLRSAGSVLDQNTTWTLPNASGTLALTSNIAWGSLTGDINDQTDLGDGSLDLLAVSTGITVGTGNDTVDASPTSLSVSNGATGAGSIFYAGYGSLTAASITGSASTSFLSIDGTWNTSGTPTALKLNVTDTASNAASLLADFQVGGSSRMKVSKSDTASTSPTTGTLVISGGIGAKESCFATAINIKHPSFTEKRLSANSEGFSVEGKLFVASTADSTSAASGALQVFGGIGALKSVSVGTTLNIGDNVFLSSDAAASLQLGSDHATVATAQTFKAHDVTTGTGASMTIAGGKGSVSGGSVILATSATNGAPTAVVTVAANGGVVINGPTGFNNNTVYGASAYVASRTSDGAEGYSDVFVTNRQASGTVTRTLVTYGTPIWFSRSAAHALRIAPSAGKSFLRPDGTTTTADKYLELGSVGAAVLIIYDGEKYVCLNEQGTITVEP